MIEETEFGWLLAVTEEPLGDELIEDAPVGSTSLTVDDAADFNEGGGRLRLVTADGTSEDLSYTECDDETGVITLATETTLAAEEGDQVLALFGSTPAVERYAHVALEGEDYNDDAAEALIPQELASMKVLQPGVLYSDDGPTVEVGYVGDELYLVRVHLTQPEIDGSSIDPATLPERGSDGLPPVTPTLEVNGGVGAFHVRVTPGANPDPVIYDLYITDEDPGDPVTPDSAHLYAEDIGTSTTVRYQKEPDPDTGEPAKFAYDTDYWFYVVPREEIDGPGTATAAVSARLVPITGEDISVEYAYAGELTADQIIGGTINADVVVGGTFKTAQEGQRLEFGSEGLVGYDSLGDPSVKIPTQGQAIFAGDVNARVLTSREGATFEGDANVVAANGTMTLAAGTESSTLEPQVENYLVSTALQTPTVTGPLGTFAFDPTEVTAFTVDRDGAGFLAYQQHNGGTRSWWISTSGSVSHSADRPKGFHYHGTVFLGQYQYYIGVNSQGNWWLGRFDRPGFDDGLAAQYNRLNPNQKPVLSTDGTDIRVAELLPNGVVAVRRYNPNNLSNIVGRTDTHDGNSNPVSVYGSGQLGSFLMGDFDYGGTRMVFAHRGTKLHIKTAFAGGAMQPSESWIPPVANRGLAWEPASGKFWMLGADARLYRFEARDGSNYVPPGPTEDMWAGFTWCDSVAGHETTLSPKTKFQFRNRYPIRVTAPERPDGVDSWKLYLARAATIPPDNEFHRMTTPVTSRTSWIILQSVSWTNEGPPSGNSFPADTPAVLRSAGAETVISGNGDVQVGKPITLHNEDWHYVGESGEPAFNGDWKNDLVTERRLRFRKDAAGVVWILGQVSRSVPLSNGNGDARVIFTLPEAYWPVETVSGILQFQQMTGTSTPEKFGSMTIHSDGRVQFWPENHSGGTYLSVLISYLP